MVVKKKKGWDYLGSDSSSTTSTCLSYFTFLSSILTGLWWVFIKLIYMNHLLSTYWKLPSICYYPYPCCCYYTLKKKFLFYVEQPIFQVSGCVERVIPDYSSISMQQGWKHFLSTKMKTHGRLVAECHVIITISSTCLYAMGTQAMKMGQAVTQYQGVKIQIKPTELRCLTPHCAALSPEAVSFLLQAKRANTMVGPLLAGPNPAQLHKSVTYSSQEAAGVCNRAKTQRKTSHIIFQDWTRKK